MEIAWAILLLIAMFSCWLLTIIGLPGNWLMIAAAAWYVFFGPETQPMMMHWGWLIAMTVIASVGELLEFLAGSLGVTKMGGSKRGASLAFAGSIAGGIAGLFIGSPIPVIGQVVAALAGACLGAFVGAAAGEKWKGRDWDDSVKIGAAAAVGRLTGTMGKIALGLIILFCALTAVIFGTAV